MTDSANFWLELRAGMLIRGDRWVETLQTLPDRLNWTEIQSLLQSANQLTHCNMTGLGQVQGLPVFRPVANLEHGLPEGVLNLENLVLQWLFQFTISEKIMEVCRDAKLSLALLNPGLLNLLDRCFHFMTYIATLIVMREEGLLNDISYSEVMGIEPLVRNHLRGMTDYLPLKTADYGESFRRHGLPGSMPRLWDKIARYIQLQAGQKPNFEKKEDSARDLLGYSAIAWSLVLEIPEHVRQGRAAEEEQEHALRTE